MGVGYYLLAAGCYLRAAACRCSKIMSPCGCCRHLNLPNDMNSDANFEFFPGSIGCVDRSMKRSSERQTGTVPQGQTEQTGLSHETACNFRLLGGERHGFMDRAQRVFPRFSGIAPATHQFRMN